jgi:hypothetical protein
LIKLIAVKDEKNSKNELEETHFTTNQDYLNDKKLDFIEKGFEIAEKITVYSINQNQNK